MTLIHGRRVWPYVPGLGLVVLLATAARALAPVVPPIVTEVVLGVGLGLVVANVATLPDAVHPGLRLAVTTLLRIGIVLLGIRLSLGDIFSTGLSSLLVITTCMALALGLVIGLAHLLGVPTRLAVLIAVGTAVCGNSAIIATAPVIEAEQRDVSFAVATITVLGTLAVLVYPFVGHALGLSDLAFGYWAGVAVSDTSQVTATGFAYSVPAGDTATIVKLTRNTLMGPLIVLIGALYVRSSLGQSHGDVRQPSRFRWLQSLPLFVVGFLVMALLNTLGLVPADLKAPLGETSKALILVALVGVGLSTNIRKIRLVGIRPFLLGVAAAITLSLIALGLTRAIISS